MVSKNTIKKEIQKLLDEGNKMLQLTGDDEKFFDFNKQYHDWYTKSLKVVSTLAADRLDEFRGYYEIDPKRKSFGSSTYVIQDYLKGIGSQYFDHHNVVALRLVSQINILSSLFSRIDSVLANLEGSLIADFQDAELSTALKLKKVNLRAAGALAGVVLEAHLQRVAKNHSVKIRKANPTISDLNDLLKQANVYDTPTWRKIQFLGDIRNLCSHKKNRDPKEEEVDNLIEGINWAIKNLF